MYITCTHVNTMCVHMHASQCVCVCMHVCACNSCKTLIGMYEMHGRMYFNGPIHFKA